MAQGTLEQFAARLTTLFGFAFVGDPGLDPGEHGRWPVTARTPARRERRNQGSHADR